MKDKIDEKEDILDVCFEKTSSFHLLFIANDSVKSFKMREWTNVCVNVCASVVSLMPDAF